MAPNGCHCAPTRCHCGSSPQWQPDACHPGPDPGSTPHGLRVEPAM